MEIQQLVTPSAAWGQLIVRPNFHIALTPIPLGLKRIIVFVTYITKLSS